MKKAQLLLIILLLLMTAGCTGQSKEEEIKPFLSKSDDTYLIHLFYDYHTELDQEMLSYMNSKDELLKVIQGIQVYDVGREDNQSKAKKLEIDKFPAILVTDHKEVKLTTHEVEEVKRFFDKIIN